MTALWEQWLKRFREHLQRRTEASAKRSANELWFEQFMDYLRFKRRVGLSSQRQYRSVVKDWIEFTTIRGHEPACFDRFLVDTFLHHRARRNRNQSLAQSSRDSYRSNVSVFCRWASAGQQQPARH